MNRRFVIGLVAVGLASAGLDVAWTVGAPGKTSATCVTEPYTVTDRGGNPYGLESCHTLTGPWRCLVHVSGEASQAGGSIDVTKQLAGVPWVGAGPRCATR